MAAQNRSRPGSLNHWRAGCPSSLKTLAPNACSVLYLLPSTQAALPGEITKMRVSMRGGPLDFGLSLSGQSLPGPSQGGQVFWRPHWWPENRFPRTGGARGRILEAGTGLAPRSFSNCPIRSPQPYKFTFHMGPASPSFDFRKKQEKVLTDMNTKQTDKQEKGHRRRKIPRHTGYQFTGPQN